MALSSRWDGSGRGIRTSPWRRRRYRRNTGWVVTGVVLLPNGATLQAYRTQPAGWRKLQPCEWCGRLVGHGKGCRNQPELAVEKESPPDPGYSQVWLVHPLTGKAYCTRRWRKPTVSERRAAKREARRKNRRYW